MHKLTLSLVSLIACFAGQEILAAHAVTETNKNFAAPQLSRSQKLIKAPQLSEFSLQPHASVWGMTGSYTLAKGQLLVPFAGDQNSALFGIAEGNMVMHDGTWFAGLGFGYRQIINERIYGGYFITDYNKSISKNGFLIANPGLEILGKVWDFNVNAYIPFNNEKVSGKEGWAGSDFNNYSYERFAVHNQYDHKFQEFEQAGRGVDFRIGRVVPRFNKAKIYLGGYYFSTKDAGSIKGISAKLTYEINKYTALELTNNYDNYNHNKIMLGVKLTLGGDNEQEKKDFGLSSRLLDNIDHGYGSTIVPIKKTYTDKGDFLQIDNIWFTRPGLTQTPSPSNTLKDAPQGAQGDGTAENPFIGITPANIALIKQNSNIGIINKNPRLYFSPGTYALKGFISDETLHLDSKFPLPTGWGMYGRTLDYKQPAMGDGRPTLIGGIDIYAKAGESLGGNNVLNSLILHETGEIGRGEGIVRIGNARNVVLRNMQVGADTFATGGYSIGVYLVNGTVDLYDTSIYGASSNKQLDTNSYGIAAEQSSSINFMGGNNNVIVNSTGIIQPIGIWLFSNSSANFSGGTNNINVTSSARSVGAVNLNKIEAIGVFAEKNSTLNFNGGINNINVSSSAFPNALIDTYATGIQLDTGASANFFNGINNIYSSSVSRSDEYFDLASSIGITASTSSGDIKSTINFKGGVNTITASSSSASPLASFNSSSNGIYLDNAAINFAGGINTINARTYDNRGFSGHTSALGIRAYNNSTINMQDGLNAINSVNLTKAGDWGGDCRATGISLSKSTLDITGGENSINVLASVLTADQPQAVTNVVVNGVLAGTLATVNFARGSKNSINVAITEDTQNNITKTAYGINAEVNNARLMKDNVEIAPGKLDTLSGDYVTITRAPGAYTGGYKISRPTDKLDWQF